MSATIALGALRVAHARLFVPWQGRWIADLDVDLAASRTVPSGAQTLTVGAASLSGAVDPDRAGRFGEKAKVRLLGGAGGWQKTVPERHYHNDAGVKTEAVLSTTAAEVGERVVDVAPARLGEDFTRARGPASTVLEGLEWYVDFAGTTRIGQRAIAVAPSTVRVLEWDAERQRAEIAADELVVPGMQITDDRFGTITVRDVEQTFADGSARATAWCGPTATSRLSGALAAFVRHKARIAFLAAYRYRIVEANVDGRLKLQAVEKVRGLPDVLPIAVWPGMAGLSADFTLGTEVVVEFIAGDPARPIVRSFQPNAPPVTFTVDATGAIKLGAAATDFVALATLVRSELTAIRALFNAHVHSGGTISGSTGEPSVLMTLPAGSVSAAKAKAQ